MQDKKAEVDVCKKCNFQIPVEVKGDWVVHKLKCPQCGERLELPIDEILNLDYRP